MKKVIARKVYNTETAELIATYTSGECGGLDYMEEQLYKTEKDAYFLYGYGGPLSRYGQGDGIEQWASEDIAPYDTDAAYEWLEENGFVEKILELFAEMIEEA